MSTLYEPATYLVTLALFSLVVQGTARMQHDMLLIACIPPVFVAAIMGFTMGVYAVQQFGFLPVIAALLLPWPIARTLAQRWSARDLLIVIYLAWAVALVTALIAFTFLDPA